MKNCSVVLKRLPARRKVSFSCKSTGYTCCDCKITYNLESSLVRHRLTCHPDQEERQTIEEGDAADICTVDQRTENCEVVDQKSEAVDEIDHFHKSAANSKQASSDSQVLPKKSKSKAVRPKRPCPFCGQLKSRLTEHLKSKHKTKEEVKNALALPKDLKDRAFQMLKKQGIFNANSDILKSGELNASKLIRERTQGNSDLKICSACKGFFKASMIYKHKRSCLAAEGSTDTAVSLSIRNLIDTSEFSEEYKTDILESFRTSEYGNLIRNDDWIKQYGYFLYENLQGSCKKVEKRLSLNSKLRRLAHLFIEFKKVLEERKQIRAESCSEMFNIDHYEELKIAIAKMTRDEETGKIKNGLKLTLKYLVKDVCDAMHVYYLKRKENQKAADLGNYMLVLNKSWASFFKNAEESVITRRLTELRAPVKLPSKGDIIKLRDHTKNIIQDLSRDGYCLLDNSDFCKLRDTLVCRLTLFNARRGGEPCRMVQSELKDALEDKWIDHCRKEFVKDEIDKKLLCETKVAYLHASKIAKLVPVLIPQDCWRALNVLVDSEVRAAVGINPQNDFVFPNTKNSMGHVIGWDCVDRMSQESGLARRLTATGVRHFVSTEYALQDVSPRDRELFYKHMGHSEMINENIYQCPPAVREITHVGKILTNLDTMVEDMVSVQSSLNEDAVQDADVDKLEEFISLMAEDISTFHILDFSKKIDECDVTVDVTKLTHKKDIVLDKTVQEAAKRFFTSDAWIAVQQTVQILEAKFEDKSKGLRRKVKAAYCPQKVPEPCKKMRFGESSSGQSMIVSDSSESELLVDQSSSDDENASNSEQITKDEMQSLKGSMHKIKRSRHVWSTAEDEAVSTFFKSEINDVSSVGNKGTLHVGKRLHDFLQMYPEVLKDYPKRERIGKIRTKVLNLRRHNRERYQRNLNLLT